MSGGDWESRVAALEAAVPRRWRVLARASKLWRWEFWPRRVFYAPMIPVWVVLAARERSAASWTVVNPGLEGSSIVGESKHAILSRLPREFVVGTELVEPGPLESRLVSLERAMMECGWSYPVVVKPNVGERGAGVRLVRDLAQARAALAALDGPALVQECHPGPFEAGVFYIRAPGAERGFVFSITDKRFPAVVGDGSSTVHALIWADSRLRMQAGTFLKRLGPRALDVPAAGERVALGFAGNHCQGTMFLDGNRLITPELSARFEEIAGRIDGFCFGRFDVRYRDVEEFKAGRGFAILELNGILSESTDIYDPARSLISAYVTLARQWSWAFAIGAEQARRGVPVPRAIDVVRLTRSHVKRAGADLIAD